MMRAKIFGAVAGVAYVVLAFSPLVAGTAFAQSGVTLPNPLAVNNPNCNTLSCPVQAVISFLYTIAIPLLGIMVLWGGFQVMTAGGQPEKVQEGKKTILYAVIGFIIVLLSGGIATLIVNTFG